MNRGRNEQIAVGTSSERKSGGKRVATFFALRGLVTQAIVIVELY
jgi:hypothetical protein